MSLRSLGVVVLLLWVLVLPLGAGVVPTWLLDSAGARWADSVLSTLSLREQLAQSFMVQGYSNKGEAHLGMLLNLVERDRVGGVIFFQGTCGAQASMTNRLQKAAKVPLLIGIDGEWGLGMRLKDGPGYPRPMAWAAADNPSLTYRAAALMAKQMHGLGIHINFAPVADINTNAKNPVIGQRAFGDNPAMVGTHASAYMRGLQDGRVLASAKHFPGHGNTTTDSHHALPYIPGTWEALDTVELSPFRQMIGMGVSMVMVGHLDVPSLTGKKGVPMSLDPSLRVILRDSLGFGGLICSDALNMAGAGARGNAVSTNVAAYKAGQDVLLCAESVRASLDALEALVEKGEITREDVRERARRILLAKYATVGRVASVVPEEAGAIERVMERGQSRRLRELILTQSVTLLKRGPVPLAAPIDEGRIAYISLLGNADSSVDAMRAYYPVWPLVLPIKAARDTAKVGAAVRHAREAKHIVVALEARGGPAGGYGMRNYAELLRRLSKVGAPLTVVVYGSPYALAGLGDTARYGGIIHAYSTEVSSQRAVVEVLFGALVSTGRLPVAVPPYFKQGQGISLPHSLRLSRVASLGMEIDTLALWRADSLARAAVRIGVAPGIQVAAIKDGCLFFCRSYGKESYAKDAPRITDSTLFDVASLTKASVTVPLMLRAVAKGELSLKDTLGSRLPAARGTVHGGTTLEALLNHRGGFPSWVGFHLRTLENLLPNTPLTRRKQSKTHSVYLSPGNYLSVHAHPSPKYYRVRESEGYTCQVGESLYAPTGIADTLLRWVLQTPRTIESAPRYSDLGYILLGRVLEARSGEPLDRLADSLLFRPMGMRCSMYRPFLREPMPLCAPSGHDVVTKRGVLRGFPQDHLCALSNGVSGHAGLFATAMDLVSLAQMYLWRGTYAGSRMIARPMVDSLMRLPNDSVVYAYHYGLSRRTPGSAASAHVTSAFSGGSLGHTGYTGCVMWIAPKEKFAFVFLSNRTYPEPTNPLIGEMSLRARMMEYLYRAVTPMEDGPLLAQ